MKWVLGALIGLPTLLLLWFVTFQPLKVLPRIEVAPGFSLTDAEGEHLTSDELRGSIVLYHFTYTHCEEEICAQNNHAMATLQQQLAARDEWEVPVQLVTLAFDPARDTPQQLARFAEQVGADPDRWRILTGEPTMLKQVIGAGFETYYAPQADGTFEFDPALILVDGWGIMRAEYRTMRPDLDMILGDIDLMQEEVRNSQGAGKLAYEAAHLFLCYPR